MNEFTIVIVSNGFSVKQKILLIQQQHYLPKKYWSWESLDPLK